MSRKKILCIKCGGFPQINGSGICDFEGPFYVSCSKCGREADKWAHQNEAWWQWERDNSLFPLLTSDKTKAHDYLDQFAYTKEMYESSYHCLAKYDGAWKRTFATGGTYTMRAIMWYQHIHKPNSKESRPRFIMSELCRLADISLATR